MKHRPTLRVTFLAIAVSIVCIMGLAQQADAQLRDLIGGQQQDGFLTGASTDPEVSAKLVLESGDVAVLSIQVTLPPGSHTYSTNPPFTGRTEIHIKNSKGLKSVDGKFTADRKPEVRTVEYLGRVEEFYDSVTWKRKYRIQAGSEFASVDGILEFQVCDESCRALKTPFNAVLAIKATAPRTKDTSTDESQIERHPFQLQASHKTRSKGKPPIAFKFELLPEDAVPGDGVTFRITATLVPEYHTFALNHDRKNIGRPTKFILENQTGLEALDEGFQSDRLPETHLTDDGKPQLIHHESVVWTRRFRVRPEATSGGYGLQGMIVYQVCTKNFCVPGKVRFALGTIDPASVEVTESGSVGTAKESQTEDESQDAESVVLKGFQGLDDGSIGGTGSGLGTYILFAFLGGLILNIMPCVLPVIAIKALSFVQQAEESHERLMALNLTYSAGVLSVFITLASLAAFASLGWGGLFQSVGFNITMACIVFAMALNLLGVFELSVPGLVGSAAGNQKQEGLFGAFMTGVFATLLATPCSGPFLGTTLGWSVKQSPGVIYLVWSVMGLGMASPYIVFAFFPAAIKWLPRPGNWMVRFKEFCGIVLLGTALFIVSFLNESYTIPVLVMLLGIGLGLWMIGKLYDINSTFQKKMQIRVVATVLAVGIAYFGYGIRNPGVQLPWEDFTNSRIDEAINKEHKTVLIDFTADWCLSCKTVEKLALNTTPTLDLVTEHEIVVIRADWTDGSPEVTKWLDGLDSISIPVTAIIPANRPKRPIILRDVYSQDMLLKSLRKAVQLPAESSNRSARSDASNHRTR